MAAEIENIEIDFNLDERTKIDVLLLKKINNYENAEVLVPELTGELTDEESEIISAEDLPDIPPKLVFVDEEDIKTIALHDARNPVYKACGMVFKREKWYENHSSSCGKTAIKMPKLKKHPMQLILCQVGTLTRWLTKCMISFFILLCQVFT